MENVSRVHGRDLFPLRQIGAMRIPKCCPRTVSRFRLRLFLSGSLDDGSHFPICFLGLFPRLLEPLTQNWQSICLEKVCIMLPVLFGWIFRRWALKKFCFVSEMETNQSSPSSS